MNIRNLAYDAILNFRRNLIQLPEDQAMWKNIMLTQDVMHVDKLLDVYNDIWQKNPKHFESKSKIFRSILENKSKELEYKYKQNSQLLNLLQEDLNIRGVLQTKLIGGGTVGRKSADVDMDIHYCDRDGKITEFLKTISTQNIGANKIPMSLHINDIPLLASISNILKTSYSECNPMINIKKAGKNMLLISAVHDANMDVDLLIIPESTNLINSDISIKTPGGVFISKDALLNELGNKIRDPRSKDFHDFITLASDKNITPDTICEIIKLQQQMIDNGSKIVSVLPDVPLIDKLRKYAVRISGFTSKHPNSSRIMLSSTSYKYETGGFFNYRLIDHSIADNVYNKLLITISKLEKRTPKPLYLKYNY